MGKKIGIAVLAIVVIVAIVLIAQTLIGPGDAYRDDEVKGQKMSVACSACGTMEIAVGDWAKGDEDPETGYHKCPKCGKMTLGGAVKCQNCGKLVIGPPKEYMNPPEKMNTYMCPKCGAPVYKKVEGGTTPAPPT